MFASVFATLTMSAGMALAGPPLAERALAEGPDRPIWQDGAKSVWEVSCSDHADVDAGSVAIEARVNGRAAHASGCYPSAAFVSIVWSGRPGVAGPDVMVLGQSGGSAACGDLTAISFMKVPVLRTFSNCPAEETPILVVEGVPTFDADLALGFNGADGADTRAGVIAVGVERDGFRPNLRVMIAPPLSAQDQLQIKSVLVADLRRWADSLHAGPAGQSTPDTVEAMLGLILSGRADQARSLLFDAAPLGAGPAFKVEAFWDDLCLATVTHPLWKRFSLQRLPHGDLVQAAALRGRKGREGLAYFETGS